MSPFWILLELRVTEVDNSSQTTNHPQTNTQSFTGLMPFLSPNQQRQSTEAKCLLSTGKHIHYAMLSLLRRCCLGHRKHPACKNITSEIAKGSSL